MVIVIIILIIIKRIRIVILDLCDDDLNLYSKWDSSTHKCIQF